jgi:predicted AAA+ superfamily ATPase
MRIERKEYLEQLIRKKQNGMVKVITGIRRSGKSYLLKEIYREYLLANGISEEQIIILDLDEIGNARYRNPFEMDGYIRSKISDSSKMFYVFIDEIQKSSEVVNPYTNDPNEPITFVDTILGLQKLKNVDLYVTGSNSKMLSSDVLTMFRGRGDEIRIRPLSYSEFYNAYPDDKTHAWRDYWTYGGMPYVLSLNSHKEKSDYLQGLFSKIYLKDVLERNNVKNDALVLEDLLNYLSSSIGSLTNPTNLARTFASEKNIRISNYTIDKYIGYFEDSFLVEKAERYDVKGRKYISTPLKYYFADPGLRNAKLNFRQMEENHIMENIIFNELIHRGFNVDVGVVEINGKDENGKSYRKQLEIDFVANSGSNRYYIQSALNTDSKEKMEQESSSLLKVNDSFRKIIVQKDDIVSWNDDNGILHVSIEQFLLDNYILN